MLILFSQLSWSECMCTCTRSYLDCTYHFLIAHQNNCIFWSHYQFFCSCLALLRQKQSYNIAPGTWCRLLCSSCILGCWQDFWHLDLELIQGQTFLSQNSYLNVKKSYSAVSFSWLKYNVLKSVTLSPNAMGQNPLLGRPAWVIVTKNYLNFALTYNLLSM